MQDNSQFQEDENETDNSSVFNDKQYIRVSTAPPRPLTELEEFKRSKEFQLLEQAVICSTQLVQKNYQKYDLDSVEEFSYLWVNGEKYVFTTEVLEAGQKLLTSFYKMQHISRNVYVRAIQENINTNPSQIRYELTYSLEEFDYAWAKFEKLYVMELMIIETDARRYISRAIELEGELTSIEVAQKLKRKILVINEQYTKVREKLIALICQINAVANVEGKGRDDLTFEILIEAEGILRRVTKEQSIAVRVIAENIRISFIKLRDLFKIYEQNIEMVDPQLKNNQDLVDALVEYERCWEMGKNYFLDPKKCVFLIHFSHIIESTAEKYKPFLDDIECRDANIFLSIPCLMILKLINGEDKNICKYFLPQMFDKNDKLNPIYSQLCESYQIWKSHYQKNYEYHNLLEIIIVNAQDIKSVDQEKIKNDIKLLEIIIQRIKQLAMELQRNNPTEWNSFFNAALST